MFDPEYKYCPECRDEYRPDIEYCAECEIKLLTGEEMTAATGKRGKNGPGGLSPDDDIVPVQQGDLKELKGIAAVLEEENISCILMGQNPGSSCGKGCCGGSAAYLAVKREDVLEAQRVIRIHWDRTTGFSTYDTSGCDTVINMESGDSTCPACGFQFQTQTDTCPDCGLCL